MKKRLGYVVLLLALAAIPAAGLAIEGGPPA